MDANWQTIFLVCIVVLLVGMLIAFRVVEFLNNIKKSSPRLPENDSGIPMPKVKPPKSSVLDRDSIYYLKEFDKKCIRDGYTAAMTVKMKKDKDLSCVWNEETAEDYRKMIKKAKDIHDFEKLEGIQHEELDEMALDNQTFFIEWNPIMLYLAGDFFEWFFYQESPYYVFDYANHESRIVFRNEICGFSTDVEVKK